MGMQCFWIKSGLFFLKDAQIQSEVASATVNVPEVEYFYCARQANGASLLVWIGIKPDQIGSSRSSSSSFGIPVLVLADASSNEKASAVVFLTSLSFIGRR
jgi:hypothetical protein